MPSSRPSAELSDFDIDHQIPGSFPHPPQTPVPTTNQQSLAHAVFARKAEYTEPRQVRIKVGSWNVAACKGTEKDIGGWFIEGGGVEEALTGLKVTDHGGPQHEGGDDGAGGTTDRETVEEQEKRASARASTLPRRDTAAIPSGEDIDIYVLGLQEIVDVASAAEALRPYVDPAPANRFKAAIEEALPLGYRLVAEQQLIGMLVLIYVHANLVQDVHSVSTTSVGTGFMGYMGNKGAVTARIVLGETTQLVFVNSHLAAGADQTALERRNWDAAEVVKRTKFEPIVDSPDPFAGSGQAIGDEDYTFWFGDLNYRLEGIPGDDVRRLLMLHTRNEYDLSQAKSAQKIDEELKSTSSTASVSTDPSTATSDDLPDPSDFDEPEEEKVEQEVDPAALQTTLDCLLPHDELQQQMRAGKSFHDGWREGPIKFLPTYKYDVGSVGVFDSSEKRRCPSWCDRILYRTRKTYEEYQKFAREKEEMGRRSKEAKREDEGQKEKDDPDGVLFEYDPDEDGDYDPAADGEQETQESQTNTAVGDIKLEYYVAHQRVLSSDHKPLNAVFTLTYDAVDPDRKTKIHAEEARRLDRAENEGRPTVTVIVDKATPSSSEKPPNQDDTKRKLSDASSRSSRSEKSTGLGAAAAAAAAPSGDVSDDTVDFGHIHEGEKKHRNVVVANTGQVPAVLSFVDRPSSMDGSPEGPFPSWINATYDREPDAAGPKSPKKKGGAKQPTYTLQPGDVLTIDLSVLSAGIVETLRKLSDAGANKPGEAVRLEDILILRVEGGRDHFLPVTGKWITHSVEKSVERLKEGTLGLLRGWQKQKPSASG